MTFSGGASPPETQSDDAPSPSAATYDFDLCLTYQRQLKAHALRLARNPDTAQDLVQETMIKAWQAWSRFTPDPEITLDRAVSSWLHEILLNTFINDYRRRTRHMCYGQYRRHDVLMATYGCAEEGEPLTDVPGEDLGDEIEAALADLAEHNPRWRAIIRRVYCDGTLYRQVAEEFGIRIGTVMSSLNRARSRLVVALAEYAEREYRIVDRRDGEHSAAQRATQPSSFPGARFVQRAALSRMSNFGYAPDDICDRPSKGYRSE